jgi:hypothetical protein
MPNAMTDTERRDLDTFLSMVTQACAYKLQATVHARARLTQGRGFGPLVSRASKATSARDVIASAAASRQVALPVTPEMLVSA